MQNSTPAKVSRDIFSSSTVEARFIIDPDKAAVFNSEMNRSHRSTAAKRAWQLLFDYFMVTSPQRAEALADRGLTPNDARALWSLDADNGKPIGTLAKSWKCDPSNATFIVDRLVGAGLASRSESPTDRRVKLVRLSTEGSKTKSKLIKAYLAPPAELTALPIEDLKSLIDVLEKLLPADGKTRKA